ILLDNAVKYTLAQGNIQIGLRVNNEKVMLSVADSGIGISEEDQPRVFERFYRADKARNRESGGSGLGLAIALWIVQQHKGEITLTSKLGQGSIFTIVLLLNPNHHRSGEHRQIQSESRLLADGVAQPFRPLT